jgi:hypothetical protein
MALKKVSDSEKKFVLSAMARTHSQNMFNDKKYEKTPC